ncbi:MAG: RraA family protein [Acidobacteriota bacterium]
MPDSKPDIELLATFPTAFYTDVYMRLGMRGWISGLQPVSPLSGRRLVGPALTVRYLPVRGRQASPTTLYEVIRSAQAGDVLAIQAPYPGIALVGDLATSCARAQGLAGIVLDGYIRDVEEVKNCGLPVFCRGISMEHPPLIELHDWGATIECGGAQIRGGDFLVGDDDGVVVVPPEELDEVVNHLGQMKFIEEELKEAISREAPLESIQALFRRKTDS